jgi:hypothetical protein
MPLDVRILGASQPLSEGRRYDLLCQSSGSRPPASITWKLDGKRLKGTKETVSGPLGHFLHRECRLDVHVGLKPGRRFSITPIRD